MYPSNMFNSSNPVILLGTHNNVKWKPPFPSPFAYKTGVTSSNQRPLTNNDMSLTTVYRQGLARPLKGQFRKASNPPIQSGVVDDANNPSFRQSHSQRNQQLLAEIISQPGRFNHLEQKATDVRGIKLEGTARKSPYLSENPRAVSCNTRSFCCNQEKNARRRAMPASTLLKKNYFTTLNQYRQNRCMTNDQKLFNFFQRGTGDAKPGAPQTYANTYLGQCYPMMCGDETNRACSLVVYKPSNYKYAKQGGVTSSFRTYDLAVTTTKYAGFANVAGANVDAKTFPYVLKNRSMVMKQKTSNVI